MKRILSRAGGPFLAIAVLGGAVFGALPARSQSPAVTKQAQSLIDPQYRGEVLFIRGKGTPTEITTWDYFFYDPTAPHKFREVRIVNGQVDLFQPADLNRSAVSDLVFDPGRNPVRVEAALKTARDYADKSQISYNQTRVLLRRPAAGQPPAWRVELLQDGRSRGVVFTDSSKGSYVRYTPASSSGGGSSGSSDSGPHSASEFGEDVKSTFLGIGGDLEEFFTGKRTVDR